MQLAGGQWTLGPPVSFLQEETPATLSFREMSVFNPPNHT